MTYLFVNGEKSAAYSAQKSLFDTKPTLYTAHHRFHGLDYDKQPDIITEQMFQFMLPVNTLT